MCKTDMFIPLVQKLFDDIIIRNEFSANEHPHTLAGLQSSLTHKFNQFWKDNKQATPINIQGRSEYARYPTQRGSRECHTLQSL